MTIYEKMFFTMFLVFQVQLMIDKIQNTLKRITVLVSQGDLEH